MNFIDKALANKDNLSNDDFLQAMANIYNEPEVREIMNQYPQYIQNVIYIIDYDTELQMEGLEGILEGSLSEVYNEIYCALMSCGAIKEAHILKLAKQLNLDNDDDYEQLEKLEEQTALNNDYDSFWDLVKDYIGRCKAKEN
ncbi:DMP19 family protein [Clostridium neonatale]|uniref:DMP19 family protein n=1 Tax=Clostridium neonatale TaxID=137838 RepID=UPI003D32CDD3